MLILAAAEFGNSAEQGILNKILKIISSEATR
jgi:hypothetical protein